MKKMLFFMVTILALSCLFVTASASTINDVTFTKGSNEVFVLEEGEIGALLDVTVSEAQTASLITASYEGNRLASIKYQGSVALSPEQKTYEAQPVSVTKDTTRVDVMLWGSDDLSPVDTKESLTNVSRQIRVTDVSVAEAEGNITFKGYVDNESRKIYVEQIVDYYGQKVDNVAKDSNYYNERFESHYKTLSNTLSYKLNGEEETASLTLNTAIPQKLTVAAPSGREKTYDVILEKHVAINTYDFNDSESASTFVAKTDGQTALNTFVDGWALKSAQSGCLYNGRSRYANDKFYAVNYISGSKMSEMQDMTKDTYYNVTWVKEGNGTHKNEGSVRVIKKGHLDTYHPHLQIQKTTYDHNNYLRQDKYDYSFDFRYTDYSGTASIFTGGIAGDWNKDTYIARLIIALNAPASPEGSLGLRYKLPGKGESAHIADIFKDRWYNIRLIVDVDGNAGEKIMIVLDGEVIYKTDIPSTDKVSLSAYPSGNVFRGYSDSTASGTFYLDNIIRTYSQAKPAA